jgi:predicted RNA-binding protein YlqC (UPF0109 family)
MNSTGQEIQQFVETLVAEIVDKPECVHTSLLESGTTVVLELVVDPADVGKVIGREGRMAQSVRTLLTGVSTKLGKKAVLHIMDQRSMNGNAPKPPQEPEEQV